MKVNSRPIVSAISVTYNSRNTIGPLLEAAYDAYQAGILEVIVVDNQSSDGTATFVAKKFPWVKVIEPGANLGFARGCNKGFEHSCGDFVLLLNPDAILSLEALRNLLEFFDQYPSATIAAPAIREANGELQHAGGLTTPSTIIRSALGLPSKKDNVRTIKPGGVPFQTDWVCGAIFMIKRKAFQQLDGFDPRYFLYFDETDLCRRAIQTEMEIWAVGTSVGFHEGGASARLESGNLVLSCIPEHFYQSRFYYLCKFFGGKVAVLTEIAEIVLLSIRTVLRVVTLRRPDGALRARLAGPIAKTPANVDEL